jgi:sulfatase-modifying factor enzyme 1
MHFNYLGEAQGLLEVSGMSFSRLLPGVCGLLLALAGCAGDVPTGQHGSPDASLEETPDAKVSGGTPDARTGSPDAKINPDARTADAMPMSADAGPACTFNDGRMGTCMYTTACAAAGGVSESGHCPGPADYRCCVIGGSPKPEPNEGLTEEPGTDGCPSGMLRIPDPAHGFCIDRFEAALEVVNDDGSFTPWSPYYNPTGLRVVARSLRGAVPQGYITGEQAKAACAEAGKRLCTDSEWLRACGGPDNLTYPYGDTRETGVCNDHRDEHPCVELFGSVTNLTSPLINQLHDTVDRTGARTGCVTAEGAMDMMGNLHEWTADPNGTFRGGFYVDTVINGNGCKYVTTAHNTLHYDYSTGFRCCHD